MESTFSLVRLEKESWKAFYKSGVVDISLGLLLIVASLCHIFDEQRYYLMLLYLLPVFFVILAGRYIVAPRMGTARFARRRVARKTAFIIAATSLLATLVLLTSLGKTGMFPASIPAGISITAIILLICFGSAYFLGFDRLYLYGIVLAIAFNLNEYLPENPGYLPDGGYAYLFASLFLLAIGDFYLVRFLREYPLPPKGTDYERR